MHRYLPTAPGKWLLKLTALIAVIGGTKTVLSVSPESLDTFYCDFHNTFKYFKCFLTMFFQKIRNKFLFPDQL